MASLATAFDLVETPVLDDPAAVATAAGILRSLHLRQARGERLEAWDGEPLPAGPLAFMEYALADEKTGAPIENGPHHVAWQEFLDENDLAVVHAPVGHGKTQQVAVGRVLWALGDDPTLRVGIVCATDAQARERLVQIRSHILGNPRVREVFPDLRLDALAKNTEHELTVERPTIAKDASVRAYGVGSKALQGARLDVLILDDVVDRDNSATPELRAKVVEWFDAVAFTRRSPGRRFRVWAIGTPWHRDDLLHVLGARPAFARQVWSAVLNPDAPREEWETLWSEVFTPDEARFLEANSTPHAFARKYLCRVRDEASARFQRAWIQRCLDAGRGRTLLDEAPAAYWNGPLLPTFTGVDLGVGQTEKHDLSVLFTIALLPDGRRLVVDVQSGRWTGPEIVQRLARVHYRYRSIVVVESNAAQDFIRQFAEDDDVPVEAFTTTGRRKHDEAFGLETLGVELRAGRWVIPSNDAGEANDPEVAAWIREMLDYRPDPREHTGDRLMASWIARERARAYVPDGAGTGAGDVKVR